MRYGPQEHNVFSLPLILNTLSRNLILLCVGKIELGSIFLGTSAMLRPLEIAHEGRR